MANFIYECVKWQIRGHAWDIITSWACVDTIIPAYA